MASDRISNQRGDGSERKVLIGYAIVGHSFPHKQKPLFITQDSSRVAGTYGEDGPKPTDDGPKPTGDGPKPTGDGPDPTGDGPDPTGDGPDPTGGGPDPTGDGPNPTGDYPEKDGRCCQMFRVGYSRDSDYSHVQYQCKYTKMDEYGYMKYACNGHPRLGEDSDLPPMYVYTFQNSAFPILERF